MLLCFVFLHTLAIVCLVLISISIWIKIGAILLVLVSAVNTVKHYALLRDKNSIVKLFATSSPQDCKIKIKSGALLPAHIENAGWLFGYFAIIVLRANSNKHKCIIAKDMLSQEQFYTLRLYLRSINALR